MSNPEQFYFSEKSLACRWGMSFRTLQRWRWKGTGPPYIKIGGRVRYHLDNIKKFEEENRHQRRSANQYSCNKDLSII
ncbi:MAG: DNA-binding protein [Proteobacteria bacterium]|nr:DNA-binding protein [Pseudomonadota bacterium]